MLYKQTGPMLRTMPGCLEPQKLVLQPTQGTLESFPTSTPHTLLSRMAAWTVHNLRSYQGLTFLISRITLVPLPESVLGIGIIRGG